MTPRWGPSLTSPLDRAVKKAGRSTGAGHVSVRRNHGTRSPNPCHRRRRPAQPARRPGRTRARARRPDGRGRPARRWPTPAGIDVAAIDSVRTVSLLSWRYLDPGSLVAERLGVGHAVDSGVSAMGGNSPQMLLNQTALDILAGDVSCVLLAGAESWRTRMKYRADGREAAVDHRARGHDAGPRDRQGRRDEPRRRDLAGHLPADPGVPHVRAGPPPPPGAHGRRARAGHRRAVVALLRGGGQEPARLDPGGDDARGDRHADARPTAWSACRTRR